MARCASSRYSVSLMLIEVYVDRSWEGSQGSTWRRSCWCSRYVLFSFLYISDVLVNRSLETVLAMVLQVFTLMASTLPENLSKKHSPNFIHPLQASPDSNELPIPIRHHHHPSHQHPLSRRRLDTVLPRPLCSPHPRPPSPFWRHRRQRGYSRPLGIQPIPEESANAFEDGVCVSRGCGVQDGVDAD